MIGSEQNRQAAHHIKRKQPEQPIPPTDKKEGGKGVREEERPAKGDNPERERANYGVVTEFQEQMMDVQKEGNLQGKRTRKEEQTKNKQTESENLIRSPGRQEDSTILGLIHSTEDMITGSIEKLKKLIDTSPQTLKEKTLTRVKDQTAKPQVVTEDLLNLKTEEKGDASTENKTEQVPFSEDIFEVYPEDPNHPPKEHHHDYKLIAEEGKQTEHHKREHKSKGEKNKKDSRIRKLSEQQHHPRAHKLPKLAKNKSIALHSMEDEMKIKKRQSQVEQKSFEELNKERHFDVPQFGDGQMKLVACKEGCGRKYSEDRIWKHQGICMFMHKHQLFNIQDHRLTKEEKEAKKKLSKFSKKKNVRNEPMTYNWRNKSSFLRALIRKNLKRRYKTFYDIKENCSREEWERTKEESGCYQFWLNTINYRQGEKTVEQLKRENVFDVPEFVSNQELWMMQCREGCKRRFKLSCILSHEIACKRVFQTKRPVYDTRAHRMTADQKKYANLVDGLTKQEREQKAQGISWRMKSQELWTDIKSSINSKFETMYHFFFNSETEEKPEMKEAQSSEIKTEEKIEKPAQTIEQTEGKIQKSDPKSKDICESHQKPCQVTKKNCQTCKSPSQTCETCQQGCTCQKPCQCPPPCCQNTKKTDQKTQKSVMAQKQLRSNLPLANPKSEKKADKEKTEITRPKAT